MQSCLGCLKLLHGASGHLIAAYQYSLVCCGIVDRVTWWVSYMCTAIHIEPATSAEWQVLYMKEVPMRPGNLAPSIALLQGIQHEHRRALAPSNWNFGRFW